MASGFYYSSKTTSILLGLTWKPYGCYFFAKKLLHRAKLWELIKSWLLDFTIVVKLPQFHLDWPGNHLDVIFLQKNHCTPISRSNGAKLWEFIKSWFLAFTTVVKLPQFYFDWRVNELDVIFLQKNNCKAIFQVKQS